MLYGFSGFGMPVSTTACLVFELVGAALFLAGFDNVQWGKVGTVSMGIIISIITSGVASFMVMRVFRAAVRDKADDRDTVLLHGPWISGAIFTWLLWFMVFKGLKNVSLIERVRIEVFDVYGEWFVLLIFWSVCTLLAHLTLVATHQHGYKYLFPITAVLRMICMAFAFGQNDLANAASPGLAGLAIWQSGGKADDLADIASKIPITVWALFGCGLLMALGMFSPYAQRVTRAAVNTGSQHDNVTLYAPQWCKRLATAMLRLGRKHDALAPEPSLSDRGKKVHYDTLRASVITGVSASVIAFASGRGLPVSTTYVAFAAVLGSGLADRIFSRGDAATKLARAIWVISCWFIAPVIAIVSTGLIASLIYHLSTLGLVLCIVICFSVRLFFRRSADQHEQKHHMEAAREPSESAPADSQVADAAETTGDGNADD